MSTLPTTSKGTAKVQPNQGIKIHYLYYWCNAFRNPGLEKTQVKVRYDPFNIGIAYAFVGKKWVQCHSEYYQVFQGRSEKELMLATLELRARMQYHSRQFTVTAKKLAEFLNSVEAEEKLLVQRLRDREANAALAKSGINLNASIHRPADEHIDSESLPVLDDDLESTEIYEEF